MDGMAVRITPSKQIQIGTFSQDKRDGEFITIFTDGTIWKAIYKQNELKGIVKTKGKAMKKQLMTVRLKQAHLNRNKVTV